MNLLDLKQVKLLCYLQLREQKAFIWKALACSALLILIHMLVYVGDFKKCCESAVMWTLFLSFLFPPMWTFTHFIGEQKKQQNKPIFPASYMEKYVSVWLTSLVNIFVWIAVVGTVSVGAIWAIGNYYYGMPMSQFLTESFEEFSFITLILYGLLLTSAVLVAISWKSDSYWHYCMPLLMLVAAATPVAITGFFEVTSFFDIIFQGAIFFYILQSLGYMVWGYFLFKEAFTK